MKILGRILGVAAIVALASPALAQKGPARYGEEDKAKTPAEVAAEKEAERAYRRSLGNIPEQQKSDPWGTMRGNDSAAFTMARTSGTISWKKLLTAPGTDG